MTAAPRQHRWHAARRWRHSLRWRLLTLFVLLALCTSAVFLLGTQRVLRSAWQGWVEPILADHVDRLAAEIGSPPDAARAAAIAARLPVVIRIDGPRVHYDSHAGGGHAVLGRDDRAVLVRSTADGHRISFGLAAAPAGGERPRWLGAPALAALLLLLVGAYAALRHLLRPLGAIGDGVARFGGGDFSRPIEVRRRDELGDLAERINRMAAGLHGMLDAKRALLLAISHELRSPLTRARVNAELIPDSEHRSALLRDLAAMRDLIADLLEGERLSAGHAALHAERIDLAALAREAVQAAAAPVRLDVDASIGEVSADAARLRLLLRNLVDNALRHAAAAAAPPTLFVARRDDGAVEIGVRDHGPGVDAAQLARLAEPFYRADAARSRASGGVGLGLYLCRLVAQAHRGELVVEAADPGLRVAMRWHPIAAP